MALPRESVEVVDDPNVLDVYVDAASARTSPWTVLIEFGRQRMPESGEMDVLPIARIRMSPHHAKATAMMLSRIMEQFEAKNGVLELRNIQLEESGSGEGAEDDG